MDLPLVAIVGRPNVGKSTLLNRVLGRREAIVEQHPGVTRDRKTVVAEWLQHTFRLVDTGGWLATGNSLDQKVSAQSERAMREADVILLVVDATVGVTEEDSRVAAMLRRLPTPVLVVVNKVDDAKREASAWEFVSLGLGDPIPVSALHGRGSGDLLDAVVSHLPEGAAAETEVDGEEDADEEVDLDTAGGPPDLGEDVEASGVFSVTIVGRPNVGKSTLFNRLIGDEQSVVHDLPGTTRDTIDTLVDTPRGPVRFVDTAGMRRRAKVDEGTEYYSVVRALRAVDLSDVALLVIDATVGVTHQDQRLAERVDGAGCPIVVLLNKWDLLGPDEREEVLRQVEDRLHFVNPAAVLRISALTGKGVHRLLPALDVALDAYQRRVPTVAVNQVLRAAQSAQAAPGGARVLYATQGATHPPTFTLFANRELPQSYLRYLERKLREAFDLGATPVKLRVRRRSN